ncbi:MAG: hypothetical protein ACM30G_07030, partial [Micromonosporaceae bacterium]
MASIVRIMEPPPKKSAGREVVEAAVQGGLNALPMVGGPLATAFAYAVGVPFEWRMSRWLAELAEAVEDLSNQVEGVSL